MTTTAMRGIEDALPIAERFGDDLALAHARSTLGFALAHRDTDAERDRGQKLLAEVSDVFLRRVYLLCELPIVNIYVRGRGPAAAMVTSRQPKPKSTGSRTSLLTSVG
jgi:hypothetical protein